MLDFNALFEFSRLNCVAICAALVPANLLATGQTLLLLWFRRPFGQICWTVGLSYFYATLLVMHVATWLMIGIVQLPTFVLLILAALCIGTNVWAMAIAPRRCVTSEQPLEPTIG